MTEFKFDTIKNDHTDKTMHIKIERIRPFMNTCVVTGGQETVNLEVEYVPNEKLLEIVNYRKQFDRDFNVSMEGMCSDVFDAFMRDVEPKWLKVTIYLDERRLTPWNVTICSED